MTLFVSCVKPEVDNVKPQNLKQKAQEALEFCKSNNLEQDYCILVDFGMHSGKKRMFVWDMKGDSLKISGMVSHGCGESPWGVDATKTTPVFSNEHESHCSSKGMFKIGKRGYSSWGINVNYKLHGLESTNDNAYDRVIVLHSWDMMSTKEVYPRGSPEGWGCPAVSNDFMKQLDALLKNKDKDVLLWIYE